MGMFGFSLGKLVLAQAAWFEIDGIWNLIFVSLLVLFYMSERIGKYLLLVFLSLWAILQFRFHWYYTIFGATPQELSHIIDFITVQ